MLSDPQPFGELSLKEACIRTLEGLILSGHFKIGEKLPSERRLAEILNVSRPVLHEALVDLSTKGLVTIQPRKGVFINDFRRLGSVALLSSLLVFHGGDLDVGLVHSLVAMRTLIEAETARLAARNRSPEHLEEFRRLLEDERQFGVNNMQELSRLTFAFHLLIAIASGNLIYPLIVNSFRNVYLQLMYGFFTRPDSQELVTEVLDYHERLVKAFNEQDEQAAAIIMEDLLVFGEERLLGRR